MKLTTTWDYDSKRNVHVHSGWFTFAGKDYAGCFTTSPEAMRNPGVKEHIEEAMRVAHIDTMNAIEDRNANVGEALMCEHDEGQTFAEMRLPPMPNRPAPPPVGTVVEYDGRVGVVETDADIGPIINCFAPRAGQSWSRYFHPDWSRVTVVPVPEGWEPVATREEATPSPRAPLGTAPAMVCDEEYGWDFNEGAYGDDSSLRYIWLRRKPAEQPLHLARTGLCIMGKR